MLRLIHNQVGQGRILVDDIDDGLPNKANHRLGSEGDPKAYKRDGYANEPKQPCYIPRTKLNEPAIAGYIDLRETQRVLLSAGKGKIYKLQQAGLITVVSLLPTDLATPVVATATLGTPGAGDLTLSGTGFLSVLPDISTVTLSGAGVGSVTLTRTQILAGAGGAFTGTSIVIDTLLAPGLADGDTITVRADGRTSNTFILRASPIITGDTLGAPGAGDVTLAGTSFLSDDGSANTVTFAGAGVGSVTLTRAQVLAGAGGVFTDTAIVVDTLLVPGLLANDTATVLANAHTSNTFTLV
jgi:hypothetical protein